jgi:hypothetical protein
MKNKILTLILLICIINFSYNNALSLEITKNDINNQKIIFNEEASVIENFPYISQETNFFCTYACPSMIIKYYGIDTSLNEILFNSGVGYSLIYSHPNLKRFFLSCIATSNWNLDRKFLAEIYGLSYQEFRFNEKGESENIKWEKYWSEIKKNIINQTPVITIVDPIYLKSIRDCIKSKLNISNELIDKIPDYLWNFFPCFMNHMIVIIGYNENNNTICYNDPSTEVFGYPKYGSYSWMNLTDFRNAMKLLSNNQPYYSYFLGIFHNNSEKPLEKNERFIISYNRNIERIKGNISYYDKYITEIWNSTNLGINGLEQFIIDVDSEYGKIITINSYRFLSTFYLFSISYKIYFLFDIIYPSVLNLTDFNSQMNYCYQLAIEKNYISDYLLSIYLSNNNSTISKICYNNSMILKMQSDNYSKLAENFSKFLGRGIFINKSYGLNILDNMIGIVDNIIHLDEKIININYSL